jgi:hypothetical protein
LTTAAKYLGIPVATDLSNLWQIPAYAVATANLLQSAENKAEKIISDKANKGKK